MLRYPTRGKISYIPSAFYRILYEDSENNIIKIINMSDRISEINDHWNNFTDFTSLVSFQ